MKEEDIEKGDRGRQPEKSLLFEILSDLNQAVPNHLADENRLNRLVQVRQNLKKKKTIYIMYYVSAILFKVAEYSRRRKRPPRDGNYPFLACILVNGPQRHFRSGTLDKLHCEETTGTSSV